MSARAGEDKRARARAAFVAHHRPGAALQPLRPDASHRRYFRLHGAPRAELLMDCPPGLEDSARFADVADHLRGLGLSAPCVYEHDAAAGLALIEDFGEDTFTRLLDTGHDPRALYHLAADVLAHLHTRAQALDLAVAAYDSEAMAAAALLMVDWYLPLLLPAPLAPALRADLHEAWRDALRPTDGRDIALQLRDYHVDNAILLPARRGVARCGLLDFQDASRGAAAYDLMSLLQDARHELPDALAAQVLRRYLAARSGVDRSAFLDAYWRLAAQRHARVIGVFCRLCLRDRKPAYLAHLPRLLALLETALERAGLLRVRRLLDAAVPGWRNGAGDAAARARAQCASAPSDC